MKKKHFALILIGIILLGSFINFYATNLLMSDLSNMFYGVHDAYIVASFPLFFIALDLVIAFIFVLRFARYPQYKKALSRLYAIYIAINSVLGIVTSIITGIAIYKDIMAPYPFKGYQLVMLLVHTVLLVASLVIVAIVVKGMPNDSEKKKIKIKYAFYSGFLGIMLYLAFYRFGSILWSVTYLQLRTLYLTWPFFLWVLLPLGLVIHVMCYMLDAYKNVKQGMILTGSLAILNIGLGLAVVLIGANNPLMISAISPCLPLERLASKPLDVILQFILMLVLTSYYFFYSYISYIKELKKNK